MLARYGSCALGARLAAIGAWPAAARTSRTRSTVVDLRVLAVETEPSEIILDVDLSDPTDARRQSGQQPARHRDAAHRSIPPAGGRSVTYTIVGCPNNPYAPAPPAGMGGGAFPSGGARTTVGSALATRPARTPGRWSPGPIAGRCQRRRRQPSPDQLTAAFMADLFPDQFGNLHGGFDLGEPLVLADHGRRRRRAR